MAKVDQSALIERLRNILSEQNLRKVTGAMEYDRSYQAQHSLPHQQTNIESTPDMYLSAKPSMYQANPNMAYSHAGSIGMLSGISYPVFGKDVPSAEGMLMQQGNLPNLGFFPGIMAHENQHYRDMFKRDNVPQFSKRFIDDFLKHGVGIVGYSGQESSSEVGAQLASIEASMRAGETPERSLGLKELFKDPRNILEYLRYKYALEKVTGKDGESFTPDAMTR